VEEITRTFNLNAAFSVDLIPNDIPDDTLLFFGLVDFIKCTEKPATKVSAPPRVKCIVWDLDNTLWKGTLVEEGAAKLALQPGVIDIIKELDRRGVLQSVASKNNFDEAMAVLKSYSLDDYFLHPQISWAPKSEALKTIAQKLNIGIETLMLVDDSEFERAQVRSAWPDVRVLVADRFRELPELPECQVPVTEESANRRRMYQQQAVREAAAVDCAGDYLAFLRSCGIEMQIEPLSSDNLERVHELTQRTNQMNFSGSRYERKVLEQIAATSHLDTYVISCRDRFGSYGIVGFSIVDAREPRMTDLMFSCRIQAKRVEHAFLGYILRKYSKASGAVFWADYCKTPRNAPSGQVFHDMGMEEKGERAGVTSLAFWPSQPIPDDGVIQIAENRTSGAAAVR
jgi:FkbH-like protein